MVAVDRGEGHVQDDPVKHPLTRTFDLLASEYGWTDDYILDRTLGRIRLAVDAIATRFKSDRQRELLLAELTVKGIVGALPAIGSTKGAGKAIGKYMKSLQFWKDEEEDPKPRPLPSEHQIEEMFRRR